MMKSKTNKQRALLPRLGWYAGVPGGFFTVIAVNSSNTRADSFTGEVVLRWTMTTDAMAAESDAKSKRSDTTHPLVFQSPDTIAKALLKNTRTAAKKRGAPRQGS